MFEFFKTHDHSAHKHIHGHRHGHNRQEQPAGGNGDVLPISQCPLCDKHCPIATPVAVKVQLLLHNNLPPQKETIMANENTNMPESAMTGEVLIGLFRRALKVMSRAHHSHGHTQHAQAHVLAILKEKEPMSQRELIEMLNVRSASMSEILAKLERNSFITRERSDQDKRNFIISVTEQGRAIADGHKKEYQENAEAIFAHLSAAERQKLGELLEKIIIALENNTLSNDTAHEYGFGHRGHGHHEHNEEHDLAYEHRGRSRRGTSIREHRGPDEHASRHHGDE
jgi:DNA-binding MarR family transcriptional regulator